MADTPWTYETLGRADNATLEEIMRTAQPPDLDQLDGKIYAGWLHGWRGKVSGIFYGRKFKKAFLRRYDVLHGYNERGHDDGEGPGGEWRVRMRDGRPIQLGYYRCAYVEDEPYQKLFRNYEHAAYLNYNLPHMNKGFSNTLSRVIRDFMVLPNEGDHSLMLVKAYFQFFPWLTIWHSYFLLGHPEDITFPPESPPW